MSICWWQNESQWYISLIQSTCNDRLHPRLFHLLCITHVLFTLRATSHVNGSRIRLHSTGVLQALINDLMTRKGEHDIFTEKRFTYLEYLHCMINMICMYHCTHLMKLKGVIVPYKSKRGLKGKWLTYISTTAGQAVWRWWPRRSQPENWRSQTADPPRTFYCSPSTKPGSRSTSKGKVAKGNKT